MRLRERAAVEYRNNDIHVVAAYYLQPDRARHGQGRAELPIELEHPTLWNEDSV